MYNIEKERMGGRREESMSSVCMYVCSVLQIEL